MNIPVSNLELNLETLFPFELDNFQIQAITALNANKSVVVCAPTGSGKTLVGEYAIHRALARGKRVFYTTPLKALSNQKLRDFRKNFDESLVGLITGDTLVNIHAPIVVMTTEVFRNMLYDTAVGEVGTSIEDVESVILDECHYLSDRQRGTVWEESIIYCPARVQLVALSATIGNPEQLTDWINRIHGPTELINSDFRPVPLRYYFINLQGIFPLLEHNQKKLNARLKPKNRNRNRKRRLRQDECPVIADVIRHLDYRDLLPAIYLIFSRKGCEQAVETLGKFSLVNKQESRKLKQHLEEFIINHPEGVRREQIEPLTRGIAVHHAGILPAWKELVETLFEKGLIKVVFATATLAAGINMPARTTVFSSLSKRSDDGHRLLHPSEFLQIAGRAGRRGMDEVGHVVTIQTPFEGPKEASYLATASAESLRSWFTPSYGMVLNLLQTHTIREVESLLEKSFAEYLASLKLAPEQKAIAQKNAELAKIDIELASIDVELFKSFEKLKERIKAARQILKTLKAQAEEVRRQEMDVQVRELDSPTMVYLKGPYLNVSDPLPAIFVTHTEAKGKSFCSIYLTANNRWYVLTTEDVFTIGQTYKAVSVEELNQLLPHGRLGLKPGMCCRGGEPTVEITSNIPNLFDQDFQEAPEVIEQEQKILELEKLVDAHPLNEISNSPVKLLKRYRRRISLREEIHLHQIKYRKHQSNQSYYWQDFLNLVEVLRDFDALKKYEPTPLGKTAAAIRTDNELWLSLAITSGILEPLAPHQLAAAICALITETPRPDSWTNYRASPEVIEALSQLRETRRQLFQVQRRHNVAVPVWLEQDLIGLVESWALDGEFSVDWNELCENTNLDEGDIVRMLRRTVDILWQFPQVPGISSHLQSSARIAISHMRRFPV